MKFKAITAKEARAINLKNGMETCENDGRATFWATLEDETETFDFNSKAERDDFVKMANERYA